MLVTPSHGTARVLSMVGGQLLDELPPAMEKPAAVPFAHRLVRRTPGQLQAQGRWHDARPHTI
tara:strand:- start:3501 stop:3689 length:189 start_codon:yes stop_codon:yes gene_type:complete